MSFRIYWGNISGFPDVTASGTETVHVSLAASLSSITQNHLSGTLSINSALDADAQMIGPRTVSGALGIEASLDAECISGSFQLTSAGVISVDLTCSLQMIVPRNLTSDMTITVAIVQVGAIQNITPVTLTSALAINVSIAGNSDLNEPMIASADFTIEVSMNGIIMTQAAPFPLEGEIHLQPRRGFEDLDYRPERYIR